MRNLLLASLTLSTLLISGLASAATVGWRAGETTPPTEIAPVSPTQMDTVSFTAATNFLISTFGNSCEAENWLGSPMISANTAAREFSVEFTPKPVPPNSCPLFYNPVNGIEGELGQLDPGNWRLVITNVNNPAMNATLPFSVTPISSMSAELILHTFANDQTTGSAFPFDAPFFIARPLGARCNPANGGKTCGVATLQEGAPLIGSGTVALNSGLSPPGFGLPNSALRVTVMGSLPVYTPYNYISTYATSVRNVRYRSSFGPGFGPGKRTVTFPGNGGPGTRVAINPGVNQFGGTMRLLGAMGSRRGHEYGNKLYAGAVFSAFLSSFGVLGSECTVTCYATGALSKFQTYQYQSTTGKATTADITTLGFPWTTGAVSITATAGPFPTDFRRSGYDNRTAGGLGTIQLVAPQLVRWEFPNRSGPWDHHTGAIGILRVKFIPEPSGWVVLSAGLGLLAVLYRAQTRRHRSSSAVRQVN